jgi:hypothetical protein
MKGEVTEIEVTEIEDTEKVGFASDLETSYLLVTYESGKIALFFEIENNLWDSLGEELPAAFSREEVLKNTINSMFLSTYQIQRLARILNKIRLVPMA